MKRNHGPMRALEEKAHAAAGGGRRPGGRGICGRSHKKGETTTWERIERLKDPGSEVFFPIGTSSIRDRVGSPAAHFPGAGVITASCAVARRSPSSSATTTPSPPARGGPQTPEEDPAPRRSRCVLRIPVIYLIDSSALPAGAGPSLPRARPGRADLPHEQPALGQQVPQCGVFGDCIAGGGYMPIISDKVIMTEQAYMVIAGAALVKGGSAGRLPPSTSADRTSTSTSRIARTNRAPERRDGAEMTEVEPVHPGRLLPLRHEPRRILCTTRRSGGIFPRRLSHVL